MIQRKRCTVNSSGRKMENRLGTRRLFRYLVFGAVSLAVAAVSDLATASPDSQADAMSKAMKMEKVRESHSLSEASLKHIIQLRAAYGLDTDPDFVRSLHENPAAYSAERSSELILGGILIAPDEREHAYRRAAAEWVGVKVDQIATKTLEDHAGTIINPDASITVLCVRCDNARTRDDIESRLDVVEPYELRVEQVAYSVKELKAQAASISESLHTLGIPHGGAIDLATNSIKIYLPDSATHLAKSFDENVKIEFGYVEVEPDTDYDKDDALPNQWVEGGQYISEPSFGGITSGFAVYSGFGTFILTAGHYAYPANCTGQGTTWNQGGSTLGTMTGNCQYGGDTDGSLISTWGSRANWGRYHWFRNDPYWGVPVVSAYPSGNIVGITVCQLGYKTNGMDGLSFDWGISCGTVTSNSSKSPCGGASPAWTYSLGAATYQRDHGDSGASVVWPNFWGPQAVGTHSCVGFGSTGAIFSLYSVMANKWGLHLSPY